MSMIINPFLGTFGSGSGAGNPPVFDAASSFSVESNPGFTSTFSHTTSGSNRALIVCVSWDGTPTISGITYNGVSMTNIGTASSAADGRHASQYKLSNPESGANNIVITWSDANIVSLVAGGISFTNARQTTASLTGTQATAGAASDVSPAVDVGSNTNEIVVDVVTTKSDPGTHTLSIGANQTQHYKLEVAPIAAPTTYWGASSREAGAVTVTMSWTKSAAIVQWAIAGVSVKAP